MLGLAGLASAAATTFSTAQSEFDPGVLNQGWWSSLPGYANEDSNDNHYTGLSLPVGVVLRSFYTFDLSGLPGTVNAASLRVPRGEQSGGVNLGLWDVTTAAAVVNNNAGQDSGIFANLGSGRSYGSFTVLPGAASDYLAFPLNSQALADINDSTGFFSLGAAVGPQEFIFSNSAGKVTFLDLVIDGNSIPEPGSLSLVALAALLAAGAGKRG